MGFSTIERSRGTSMTQETSICVSKFQAKKRWSCTQTDPSFECSKPFDYTHHTRWFRTECRPSSWIITPEILGIPTVVNRSHQFFLQKGPLRFTLSKPDAMGVLISDKPKYLAAATRSEPSYTCYKPPPHLISSDNAPIVVGQDFQSLFEDARFSL